MSGDGVPWDEMRWTGSHTDPIDAVLAGSDDREDLLDVAAMVHDLQATYLRAAPLRRSPELVAFTEEHLGAEHHLVGRTSEARSLSVTAQQPAGRKQRPMWKGLSTFVGTVAGKIVLGTTVAAASAGTLHATNVVDVPTLPDSSPAADQPAEDAGITAGESPDRPDHPEQAGEGTDTATANRDAATAYTDAIQGWTDCVGDAAAGQGDAETRTTGGFDPADACGERPRPADYGLNELPPQAAEAAEAATDAADAASGRADNAPDNRGAPGTPGENAPAGTPGPSAPERPTPTRPDPTTPSQAGEAAPDDVGAPAGRP